MKVEKLQNPSIPVKCLANFKLSQQFDGFISLSFSKISFDPKTAQLVCSPWHNKFLNRFFFFFLEDF